MFIDISRIPDLNKVTVDAVGLHFGAAVSIATVMNQLQQAIAIYPAAQTAGFPSLLRHLTMVGNVQVLSVMIIIIRITIIFQNSTLCWFGFESNHLI